MSSTAMKEVVARMRKEYVKARKARKTQILGELVALTGYHRKSIVRLLRKPMKAPRKSLRRGRSSIYLEIAPLLQKLWAASYFACSKRLQPFLSELLPLLTAAGELQMSARQEKLLLTISAATIDRLLAAERKKLKIRGRSTTKPGTLLRSSIPVRTYAEWDTNEPGFFEVDLVAHCGSSAQGEFLYTLNMTDVHTGWTVLAPMKGRGQRGAHAALDSLRKGLPFPLRGLDSDNDSVFINQHMKRYCDAEKITFTRCRPYKKNDQCHVEQKNWSVVRQFIGYCRLETDEQLALLGQIHQLINRYHNFYWPMMRLVSKVRNGSKVAKQHDKAATPYTRLMRRAFDVPSEQQERLRREYADPENNPARLVREINRLVAQLEATRKLPSPVDQES